MYLFSYKDLESKVWDTDKCCGCGACVGVCPTEALYFDGEAAHPQSNDYCKVTRDSVPCGACYDACPRADETCSEDLGSIISIYQSRSKKRVADAQSGGVVSSVLAAAFESNLIDGAIVMGVDKWSQASQPEFVRTSDAVYGTAGSRYVWAPILSALRAAIEDRKLHKIAIVGTPCVTSAVKRIRQSNVDVLSIYKNSIRVSLGLFCTEIFTDNLLKELRTGYGIEPWEISGFDVKGKLIVKLQDETTLELPLKDLRASKRLGCEQCVDFTSEDADLSFGSVGASSGNTVVIVRTKVGQGFLTRAERLGYIELSSGVDVASIAKIGAKKKGLPFGKAESILKEHA
ncbi:MAG TPA: Coenzyme F420 hydrogenase/dehydrogenase, beta subunit C-terminal domain [Candidatus Bathyarchaeia archaeon]|nr:Coenzyme F420 hydrogenase/dehydrogenase, beta subunit C-terminal domain [Candidatus Bathyarchaeia archaeon]